MTLEEKIDQSLDEWLSDTETEEEESTYVASKIREDYIVLPKRQCEKDSRGQIPRELVKRELVGILYQLHPQTGNLDDSVEGTAEELIKKFDLRAWRCICERCNTIQFDGVFDQEDNTEE